MPTFTDNTPNQTRTAIGEIRYEFMDTNGAAAGYTTRAAVQILDQNNKPMRMVHLASVTPILTTQERNQLMAIFARLRAEAVKDLLP